MISETSPTLTCEATTGTLILIVKGSVVMQRRFKGPKMRERLKDSWVKMWGLKNHPTAAFITKQG